MIANPPQLTALVEELGRSNWILAAIGALFDSGLAEKLREPRSLDELAQASAALPRERIERILTVLAGRGVVVLEENRYRLAPGVMPYAQSPMRTALMGDVRSNLMQPLSYFEEAGQPTPTIGWRHPQPALLQAQGDASSGFVTGFAMHFMQQLGDLATRFAQPGVRFLDVGVGVAGLSIGMCQRFPNLHIVGLDAWEVPLSLARENVARAGLSDRIELRQLPAQELCDEEQFDLAWLPTVFLPADVVPRAIERVRAALRPGGWLLIPSINPAAAAESKAVWSMVNERWGGPVLEAPATAALLEAAGLKEVRMMAGPSWVAMVVGQR